jgi:hypothetical protein
LDSDDIWTKDKLETVHTIFKTNSAVNFVIHNLDFIPEGLGIKNPFEDLKEDFYKNIFDNLFSDKMLPFPIFTIKKSTLDKIGLLDEEMIDGQYDLYVRVASKFKVYYCAKKLTYIKKHNHNISKNTDMTHYGDHLKSLNNLRNQGVISRRKHQYLKNKIYAKIAYIYHKQKQYSKAKENYRKAFKTRFFSYNGLKSFAMFLKTSLKTDL